MMQSTEPARGLYEYNRAQYGRWFRIVTAQSRESVIVTDQSGQVGECNDIAGRMFGRPRSEMIGHSLNRLICPREHKQYLDKRQATSNFFAHDSGSVEISVERALLSGGNRIRVHVTAIPTGMDDAHSMLFFLHEMPIQKEISSAELLNECSATHLLVQAIESILLSIDLRDPYTATHQRRVAHLGSAIGEELSLPKSRIEGIYLGGLLHDIGKHQVPLGTLHRPGVLNQANMKTLRRHCSDGHYMVRNIDFPWPISDIIMQHHERLDGSGYPNRLGGDQITPEAKVVAVADVVEAMSSYRPYRSRLGISSALHEVTSKPHLYDKDVAEACRRLFREKSYQLPCFDDRSLELGPSLVRRMQDDIFCPSADWAAT